MMRNSNRGKSTRNQNMNYRRTAASKKNSSKRISSVTKFFITLMVISAAVCIILFSNRSVINADESGNAVQLTKYYKTITIEPGETLWSIAEEYKSGDYKTTQDYVDELITMNKLHSDSITSGQKLIVAYFAE